MSTTDQRDLVLRLAPLDAATAAWILDLCGHLQQAIWRTHGDEIEAHWAATDSDQPIHGRLSPTPSREYVRESLLHPWLDPERLYERLHPAPQLRLA